MKSENIVTALNDIDPELVADAEEAHKPSSAPSFLKWGLIAALFCLVCSLALWYFLPTSDPPILASRPGTTAPKPTIPVFDQAVYSASDVADFFGAIKDSSTSAYTEVYVPSASFLPLCNIPVSEYWTLYQYSIPENDRNKKEFESFVNRHLTQITSELGVSIPPYTEKATSNGDGSLEIISSDWDLYISGWENYDFFAFHGPLSQRITFSPHDYSSPEVKLGDLVIEIDQRQSDDEIIASLSAVKEMLFSIFGVEFTHTSIHRSYYNGYFSKGVEWIDIYFFDEAEHPLNAIRHTPVSDFIHLSFDNTKNYDDDFISDTILRNVSVTYQQLRIDVTDIYTPSKSVAGISLEEAEALLKKSYVFGGHSCPICMAEQDAVDFSDYDFVDIVYIQSANLHKDVRDIIPFYAFYKKIGIAQNGNEIYAKTYVPAIEVSGYEEYFKSQEAKHNN